jgi:hypothetical protein
VTIVTEITVLKKQGGVLTKRIRLNDGGHVVSDGSACLMTRGTAQRVEVRDVFAFRDLINGCEPDEALALGHLRAELPQQVKIATAAAIEKSNGAVAPDLIARTKTNIIFKQGVSAYVLIDFDTKGMPEHVRARIETLGGLWAALCSVLPMLTSTAYVMRASTSSGLRHRDTGQKIPGSGGYHIYLPVIDGSDIDRFLHELHDHCWLAGLGWGLVGAAGQFLERSIVDRSTGTPERLVFEGRPIVEPPLIQEGREAVACEGSVLNTAVLLSLTDDETAILRDLKANEGRRLLPECIASRNAFVDRHVDRLTAKGIGEHAARKQVSDWLDRHELSNAFELPFDNPTIAGTTVADALANPNRFVNETMADPLEGPAYGRTKAMLLCRADGSLFINSFAHGGIIYDLRKIEPIVPPIDLWRSLHTPELPLGLLPSIIEEFAIEQSATMGTDPAGLAMGALAVAAAALPDCIKLKVKRYDSWREAARIWVAEVGLPSTRKTPIMDAAVEPLLRIDRRMWKQYTEALREYEALSKQEKKKKQPPKQLRLCLEDTTIEAAQDVLQDSPNGVLCYQDELSGWFGSMDKYNGQRGAAKDRGFWLQSYNGGSYGYNRISRGAGVIDNLSVSMLGGIQTEPLQKIAAETVDDGLIQRILPIMLRDATMGRDEPKSTIVDDYAELIASLHVTPLSSEPLRFSAAAQRFRQEMEAKHLVLAAAHQIISRKLAAHLGKYDGLFARLCLLWHCIENGSRGEVSEDVAHRVAKFMHSFLLPHARAFYASAFGLSDDHDRLTAIAGYILARKLDVITTRDVARGDRSMRKLERAETDRIFEQLEALGWIDRIPGRRPTDPPARWIVNPEVHRRFADRARKEVEQRAAGRRLMGGTGDEE